MWLLVCFCNPSCNLFFQKCICVFRQGQELGAITIITTTALLVPTYIYQNPSAYLELQDKKEEKKFLEHFFLVQEKNVWSNISFGLIWSSFWPIKGKRLVINDVILIWAFYNPPPFSPMLLYPKPYLLVLAPLVAWRHLWVLTDWFYRALTKSFQIINWCLQKNKSSMWNN